MARMAGDYGSERHLREYRTRLSGHLDSELLAAAGLSGPVVWTYPDPGDPTVREPKGLNFIGDKALRDAWKEFWPQTGNQQRWDGIARADGVWLLIEAKANVPEFVGSPCGASSERPSPGGKSSRARIQAILNQTKAALGVHRHFSWLGSYYQYANRLAALDFLARHGVAARLIFIHFLGDVFPDGCPCPATQAEWESLIEARRLTLGLPRQHHLSEIVHDVFLSVPTVAAV